jgi:hypothetical protein
LRIGLRSLVALFTAVLAFSFLACAQSEGGQAGQQPAANRARARAEVNAPSPTANLPFDPHDFSGVWVEHGGAFNSLSNDPPPMTPWGKTRYDAAKPGIGRRAQPLGNDPRLSAHRLL